MASHAGVLIERVFFGLSFLPVLHDPLTTLVAESGAFVHERLPPSVVSLVEPRQNGCRELGVLTEDTREVKQVSVEHALCRYLERVAVLTAWAERANRATASRSASCRVRASPSPARGRPRTPSD